MPIITRIVAGKRNHSRANIYLDGEYVFALSIDEVVKQGLKKGLELTDEQIAALKESDADEYIYVKLLNFLSYRPRSTKEVTNRLYKYDVKDPLKQKALLARLTAKGYLDDLAFGRWFVDSRNTHRPRSSRQLTQELQRKGLSAEVIAALRHEFRDESSTVLAILTKKLGSPRSLTTLEKQRIYAYLARHGFAWETIKEVVKSWESE